MRQVLDGSESRPQQVDMAQNVLSAFQQGYHLICEATDGCRQVAGLPVGRCQYGHSEQIKSRDLDQHDQFTGAAFLQRHSSSAIHI